MNKNENNEFFIIESEKLDQLKTKIYGYTVSDKIQFQSNFKGKLSGNGTYINIFDDTEKIILTQDFLGSYGLYLYENENEFIISNSFNKLVKFLKKNHILSLNENYSKTFISTENIMSFDETLINEIKLVPKDYKLIIDKAEKKVHYEQIDFSEKTVNINTEQGINILDNWHRKWRKIFADLTNETNNIQIKLNDNLHSLSIITLLKNNNALKKISLKNNDLKLTELTNLEVNPEIRENIADIEKSIENTINTGLGRNKKTTLQNYAPETTYLITDENIYDHKLKNKTFDSIIDENVNESGNFTLESGKITEKFIRDNIQKLQKHTKSYDVYSNNFIEELYKHTILRNTTGKNNVERYLSNTITLNPLLDVELLKLKTDENLNFEDILLVTIIKRYYPELLNLTSNISNEVMDFAEKINQKYPYKQDEQIIQTNRTNILPAVPDYSEYNNLIRKIFFSNSFKHTFLKYYSNDVYEHITRNYFDKNRFSLENLTASVDVIKVWEDVEYSKQNKITSELGRLKTFITDYSENNTAIISNSLLKKYNTARIDIKNVGSITNQIKILESDNSSNITNPQWFSDEKGVGICVISDKSEASLKIKCINDGLLKIDLRTIDLRDRNNRRFPIYVDYQSFCIDNQEILKDTKLIWHDKPFTYSKKVYNNEIVDIKVKWRPFTSMSKYE